MLWEPQRPVHLTGLGVTPEQMRKPFGNLKERGGLTCEMSSVLFSIRCQCHLLQGPGNHLQGHMEHSGKRGRVCQLEQQRAGPEALQRAQAKRHRAGPRESQLLQVRGLSSLLGWLFPGEELL